jgi:hypothetical protein
MNPAGMMRGSRPFPSPPPDNALSVPAQPSRLLSPKRATPPAFPKERLAAEMHVVPSAAPLLASPTSSPLCSTPPPLTTHTSSSSPYAPLLASQMNSSSSPPAPVFASQMEYKRALGHRIYPRLDFLRLLARHRGPARLPFSVPPQPQGSGGHGDGGGSGGDAAMYVGGGGEGRGGDSGATSALFSPGMAALLTGLQSRPELNGSRVTLSQYDEAASRWHVAVEGGAAAPLRVRSANLRVLSQGAAGQGPSAVRLPQEEGAGLSALPARPVQYGSKPAAPVWGRAAETFRPLAEGDTCDAEWLLREAMPIPVPVSEEQARMC